MSFRNIILKAWFSQRERAIDRFRRRPVETQARMKQGMAQLGIPDAAERIYDTVMALVR